MIAHASLQRAGNADPTGRSYCSRIETVVLLFTDVEGSSRAWASDPGMLHSMGQHDATLRAVFGRHAGVEFKAYIDNMSRLPDIDAIVEGRSLQVPTGIDLQYGVAAALVRRAARVRDLPHAGVVYGRILNYARRFPQREMGVMLVTDLHRSIGRPLIGVPEFAEWAASITDLMLYDMKLAS